MADEPLTDNELMQTIIPGRTVVEGYEDVGKEIIDLLSKHGIKSMNTMTKSIFGGLEAARAKLSKIISVEDLFPDGKGVLTDMLKTAEDELQKFMSDNKTQNIFVGMGLDSESVQAVVGSLNDFTTGEFGVKLTAYLATDAAISGIEGLSKVVRDKEKDILEFTKKSYDAVRANAAAVNTNVTREGDAKTFGRLETAAKQYRTEVLRLQSDFGTSKEESQKLMDSLLSAGLTMEHIGNLSAKAGGELNGLSAAFTAAKSTGLGYDEIGKSLNIMTRQLGVSVSDASQRFELLARVQSGTSMKIGDVNAAVMESASRFKFFGDNIEGAATLYKGFLNSLGSGKEDLARELFSDLAGGIDQMGDGMKAFLGMTTSIGTGGGGALGGVLEVEEALATGEGMDKIASAMKESIEKLSGSPLLTRKEAIDTGQQSTYFKQREVASMVSGIKGAGKIDEFLKMMGETQVDLGSIRGALTKTGPTGGFRMDRVQREAVVGAGGVSAVAMNRLDAARTAAQEGMSDAIIDAGSIFNTKLSATMSTMFTESGDGMTKALKGTFDKAIVGIREVFNSKDIAGKVFGNRTAAMIAMDKKAQEAAEKEQPKAEAEGYQTKGEHLDSLNRTVNAMEKAGHANAKALTEKARVASDTGEKTMAFLTTSLKAFENTQDKSLKVLSGSIEAHSNTNMELINSQNELRKAIENANFVGPATDGKKGGLGSLAPLKAQVGFEKQHKLISTAWGENKGQSEGKPTIGNDSFQETIAIIKELAGSLTAGRDLKRPAEDREINLKINLELDKSGTISIADYVEQTADKKIKAATSAPME